MAELYSIDTRGKAWFWIKQYYINPSLNRGDLDGLRKVMEAYIKNLKQNEGLGWWLNTHDRVPDLEIRGEFWISSFVPEGKEEPVRTLVVLLVSKGDPWEGRTPTPNSPEIPPIPNFDTFFIKQSEAEKGHLAFEMTKVTEVLLPAPPA